MSGYRKLRVDLAEKSVYSSCCSLIVDEPQNLSAATLDVLRMLSGYHVVGVPLRQTFLVGQPDFLPTLVILKR